MEEITDWRKWIRELPPDEKKRLMAHLDVHQSSLTKWTQGHRSPRAGHLYDLASFNPALRASLAREFPDVFKAEPMRATLQIPVEFYQDILSTLAFTAYAISGRTIATKIFEAMCHQLDPAETGLLIMPSFLLADLLPDDEPITIMHTGDGHSCGAFRCPEENEYYEMGRDSLAGLAVTRRRVVLYPQTGILAHWPATLSHNKIASAAALPLWRRGNIAGAFFVASVHANFFTALHIELCTRYADLYALSLYDTQFYDPQRIDLRVMREGLDLPEPNGADIK